MVSIVVPLYNYKRYIKENIESIINQTYTNWEIIIVDDSSKDKPLSIIEPYLSDRIQYIRLDKNVGYGAAKNVGIRAAKGEYIVILDADDMLVSNSLGRRRKYLRRNNALWVHAKAHEFKDARPYRFVYKDRKANKRLRDLLRHKQYAAVWDCIHAQTVMVHRSVYEKVGLYESVLRSMGDKEMWARICYNVEPPIYLKKFVAYYRMHAKQMHRSAAKKKNVKRYRKILNRLVRQRRTGDLSGVERL
ncbi:hypothetical protein LCGC14_0891810 [marine sediment metagenome]|uniref:Glycosyltransferase 2-like domain-containing protein n=1 Tax=marine sediment metagenome TaxID=412755 RepID=A0A0F9P3T6_9ZZZZ